MRGDHSLSTRFLFRSFVVLWASLMVTMLAADALAAPTETVLYSFTGGSDGRYPSAGLISDSNGNLYGTTFYGGGGGRGGNPYGNGGVFKLRPDGKERLWYLFMSRTGFIPKPA